MLAVQNIDQKWKHNFKSWQCSLDIGKKTANIKNESFDLEITGRKQDIAKLFLKMKQEKKLITTPNYDDMTDKNPPKSLQLKKIPELVKEINRVFEGKVTVAHKKKKKSGNGSHEGSLVFDHANTDESTNEDNKIEIVNNHANNEVFNLCPTTINNIRQKLMKLKEIYPNDKKEESRTMINEMAKEIRILTTEIQDIKRDYNYEGDKYVPICRAKVSVEFYKKQISDLCVRIDPISKKEKDIQQYETDIKEYRKIKEYFDGAPERWKKFKKNPMDGYQHTFLTIDEYITKFFPNTKRLLPDDAEDIFKALLSDFGSELEGIMTKEEINNFDEIIQQLKNTENINKTGFLLADTNELLLNNKDGIDSLENLPKTELKTEEIDEIIQLVEKSKIATKNNKK
jgi:hypothetical protein